MAIFVFVLALALAIAGGGGIYASIDLLPTEIGVLYASCGVIAISASCIVAALGALVVKVNGVRKQLVRLSSALEFPKAPAAAPAARSGGSPPPAPPPAEARLEAAATAPAPQEGKDPPTASPAGPQPPPTDAKQASPASPAPSTLVGRYSAGGAHYMIYSDGKIEAQTEDGAFTFASMNDFKAYMARRAKPG